jgi:hypothetical protein
VKSNLRKNAQSRETLCFIIYPQRQDRVRLLFQGHSHTNQSFCFMELGEEKENQNHVIKKIRRISVAMDKGELWTIVLIGGLIALVVIGLGYYYFH